ncbi:MAG: S-adenosylmethionine decarboxylase [Microthrixaceae bacterium]
MSASIRSDLTRAQVLGGLTVLDDPRPQVLPDRRGDDMVDLAPGIHRQRLVIEGLTDEPMTDALLTHYLAQLAVELDMVALTAPILHQSTTYGWAGWMHWETSGCHVYAWDEPGFFSVDIYTCKPFDPRMRFEFTLARSGPTPSSSGRSAGA